MPDTTIRPMTTDDIPIVAGWVVSIPLWQRYGLREADLWRQLETALGTDILLTADRDSGRACGFAWCLRHGGFGRGAYLRLIGVRGDQAGSGVGAALLRAVEEAVSGSPHLFLLVSDFNTGAQRFYERHGYRNVGAIPGFVLEDVTELIYHKPLKR